MPTVTVGQENSTAIELYFEDHGERAARRALGRLAA